MNTKTVALSFGLAEDSSVGMVILTNFEESFSSNEEIIVSLANYFANLFFYKMSCSKDVSFCNEDHSKISTPFCAFCGSRIKNKPSIEQLVEWLRELPGLAIHKFPYDSENFWSLEFENGSTIDYVIENSERVIADKVYELFPNEFEDE